MWLVRDMDNALVLHNTPHLVKTIEGGFWYADPDAFDDDHIDPEEIDCVYISSSLDVFPEVKWEDKEPTEVELIIKT